MMDTSEKAIQVEIMAALGCARGLECWRNNVGVAAHMADSGAMSRVVYGVGGKGAPDLLVEVRATPHAGPWLALWLEVKRPGERLRPDQEKWHAAALREGRHVAVVHSAEEALAAVAAVRAQAAGQRAGGAVAA